MLSYESSLKAIIAEQEIRKVWKYMENIEIPVNHTLFISFEIFYSAQ